MGKSNGSGSVPNRPIYSRISYLYQAAAYMANCSEVKNEVKESKSAATYPKVMEEEKVSQETSRGKKALSRRFITDLRSASLKSQIRLSPAIKHTICKLCDSLLIEGDSSTSVVENKSKGGKKPWADVLVVKCHTCGGVRRFPVQAPRQNRRTDPVSTYYLGSVGQNIKFCYHIS
ncbi:Rpr2-domain-containing protein [Hypoxylon fragiforme]|uniref:Rpr2-domain-containing protein n=1 Tax=Hypoxylon fragiforme TaxID=63214 RepID=UPI0020C6B70B|nr:Rpr2-domain-containing protein [Hypoxylon fragiforme]KAI2604896.1 Rpr2-domain-containing protein [Hypoxylon fragiforme]